MQVDMTNGSNVLDSHGVMASVQFQIKANAHAFSVLSKHLYSNPIQAILREIGCNGMDGHVMKGCADKPIEVKLPNSIDSQFYIKDFGTGLNNEEVCGLYSTYFESTKTKDNLTTGAFGLGSKSPFSLKNEFTVTSVKDGIRSVYVAHLNAEGSPAVSMLYSQPVSADDDWQHGVMVSFPVESSDFRKFENEAARVYRFFKVKPVILGSTIKLIDPTFRVSGKVGDVSWGIAPFEVADGIPRLIMGNVAYPLDLSKFSEIKELSNICSVFLKANLHVWVPIGTTQVAASREELHYDENSVKALAKVIKSVADDVFKTIYAEYTMQRANEWQQASGFYQYWKTLVGYSGQLAPALKHMISTDYSSHFASPQELKHFAVATMEGGRNLATSCKSHWDNGSAVVRVKLYALFGSGRNAKIAGKFVEHGKVTRGSNQDEYIVPFSAEPVIVVGDCKFADVRARECVVDDTYSHVVFVGGKEKFIAEARRIANDISVEMGGWDVIDASSLPEPASVSARKVGVGRLKANVSQGTRFQHYQNQTVRVLDMDSPYHISLSTLGTESQSGNKFYVVTKSRANVRCYNQRFDFWGEVGEQFQNSRKGSYGYTCTSPSMVSDMRANLEELAKLVPGIKTQYKAVVVTEAELKKYALNDNGFKPLGVGIVEDLEKFQFKDALNTVGARFKFESVGYWQQNSVIRTLIYLLRPTAIAANSGYSSSLVVKKELEEAGKDFPAFNTLLKDIEEYYASQNISEDTKTKANLLEFVKEITGKTSQEIMGSGNKSLKPSQTLAEWEAEFVKQYPFVDYFKESAVGAITTQVEANTCFKMLRHVMEMK